MNNQMTFKRYELKYLMTREQKEMLLTVMGQYMELDSYKRTTIRNIYYDTENFRLIRRSIEKPIYKEKLRIRSYKQVKEEEPVFVELKKKYKAIVYKRRIVLPQEQAMNWFKGQGKETVDETQIAREITYFRDYYGTLQPAVFLSYEREAYYALDGSEFRVTFDDNILFRQEDLSLTEPVWGRPILKPEQVLMEIKTAGGIPLWMTHFLSEQQVYKTSFSKYGSAYKQIQQENATCVQYEGGLLYV